MDNVILKGYVSHQIRGRKGADCSEDELTANCAKATNDMLQLQSMLQRANLPVCLHIPGANDLFVQKAYKAGRITEAEVLDTDCDIIKECDFLLVYNWDNYISTGMKVEQEFALKNQIRVLTVSKLDQYHYIDILCYLTQLWREKADTPQIIKL